MKVLFDTSVFVAAFYDDHKHHDPSSALLSPQRRSTGCTSVHCLVEFYSTTTRMPGKRRASPEDALRFIGDIRERLSLITLDESDYTDLLDEAAQHGIAGGAIYDALIAKCVMKANARTIYTWNTKHFIRFGPEIAARVREPGVA